MSVGEKKVDGWEFKEDERENKPDGGRKRFEGQRCRSCEFFMA